MSLEVLADVAVIGPEGTTAEESKSGLAHNPVADRAVDLWKTLFNWVKAIRAGALGSDTRFVLYVAQAHDGRLVQQLHKASRRSDTPALIRKLREDMWGKGPGYAKRRQLPDSLASFVNGVLQATDDVLMHLILNFELETGSGSPVDDLRPALREKAISEGAVDEVLKYLLGWVKQNVDRLIEQRRHAIITWEDFNKRLVAAAKRFDRSDSLAPTAPEISEADVDRELRNRAYVRQLQLIDVEERELVQAVNDYLRAASDRTSWSERGDVLEPSFGDFADKLQRHWASRRRLAEVELPGRTEIDLGRVVLANCMALQIQLQGMDVPGYFTPGSYHTLSDGMEVGWHPRFDALLVPTSASVTSPDGDALGGPS